jgi:hypothetical protein
MFSIFKINFSLKVNTVCERNMLAGKTIRLTLLFLKIVLISLLLFVFLYLRYYEI